VDVCEAGSKLKPGRILPALDWPLDLEISLYPGAKRL